MITDKKFEEISIEDLEALHENEVLESKKLEYKSKLPENSSAKRKFLAEVTSFANTSGGDIIIGAQDKSGIPSELFTLPSEIVVDDEKLRLENMLRDGVRPRIFGINIKAISNESGICFIIRIPKSWNAPHMVTYKGESKFYARNSAGKYLLDVDDLRTLFLQSETFSDKLREFRKKRLGYIISGETPKNLHEGVKTVLHIIPFGAFNSGQIVNLQKLLTNNILIQPPVVGDGWNHRFNFDGLAFYSTIPDSNLVFSYMQIFKNGIIESAESSMINNDDNLIPHVTLERTLINHINTCFKAYDILNIDPPLFIMVSLHGVQNYEIRTQQNVSAISRSDLHKIEKNDLIIPEIIVEDYKGADPTKVLMPIFDRIWNAAGYYRSMNYDKDGNWIHDWKKA